MVGGQDVLAVTTQAAIVVAGVPVHGRIAFRVARRLVNIGAAI
jgi:hypothetical protein